MSDYRAPVKDMRFVMDELAGFKALSQMPAYEEATPMWLMPFSTKRPFYQ
jgi:acyl-CoA dehydrogenase